MYTQNTRNYYFVLLAAGSIWCFYPACHLLTRAVNKFSFIDHPGQ